MKVLVTGADGFIGSHLTELLLEHGYDVRALTQYNSFNNWGWLAAIPEHRNLEIVTGDIRDAHFCLNITQEIDIVFHLAALIAIPYSYIAPGSYVDTNVTGTLNMCQAACKNRVKQFMHTSTSEVYGTALYTPIDEKHPKQPQSPYSATKIGADAIAMSLHNAFDLPLVIVRPFNTYGPRQSARAIIPTIITQIASGMQEIKLGDLTPIRDFNFVKDICKGFVALSNCADAIGQEVNIASNYETSMRDILELILKIMNTNVKIVEDTQRLRPKKSEVFRLLGDNSKLIKLTGYKAEYDIESGLRNTIEWFTDPENLKKTRSYIYNI
jgi:NAD dependent epimerase/dehydratase